MRRISHVTVVCAELFNETENSEFYLDLFAVLGFSYLARASYFSSVSLQLAIQSIYYHPSPTLLLLADFLSPQK